MPFVQGHLRNENLSFVIETECGHCHKPFQIEIDSELNYHAKDESVEPLIYSPILDIQKLEPSIIDGY